MRKKDNTVHSLKLASGFIKLEAVEVDAKEAEIKEDMLRRKKQMRLGGWQG